MCREDECESDIWCRGWCHYHYDLAWRTGFPEMLKTPQRKRSDLRIKGQRPSNGDVAIYFIRRDDAPIYVGSTNNPSRRLHQHEQQRDAFDELEMVIVRVCAVGEEVYWESKLLVDMVEQGFKLENMVSPQKSKVVY